MAFVKSRTSSLYDEMYSVIKGGVRMSDLSFNVTLAWKGTGRLGEGTAQLAESCSVIYSAPESMGGQGVGTSPEEFLIAAVSSCYSATLFGLLRKEGLAVDEVKIRAEGMVTGYPLQAKFSHLTVHPTILGGNPEQEEDYGNVAQRAREKCFIGKTIAGNVEYQVGEVLVQA